MLARQHIANKNYYVTFAAVVLILGVFMLLSPTWFYGPSWFYFAHHGVPILPAGGRGMGVCLIVIAAAQLILLAFNISRLLAVLFFLSGFVFWTAGLILLMEGLAGRQGLMEGPAYMTLGWHKFSIAGIFGAEHRKNLR